MKMLRAALAALAFLASCFGTAPVSAQSVAFPGPGLGSAPPFGLDGKNANSIASGVAVSATLTTVYPNDVIVAGIWSFNPGGPTVLSVSGCAASWTKRTSFTLSANNNIEEWWGVATSPLSACSITATLTASSGSPTSLMVFGVSGANTSSPFDTNVSLPQKGSGTGTPSQTISTTALQTIIYGFQGNNNTQAGTAGSGFTLLNSGTPGSASGYGDQYRIAASAQTSVAVAFGNNVGGSVWLQISDAIRCAAC